MRRGRLRELAHRRLEAEQLLVRLVPLGPATRGGERHDRLRPTARGELKRHVPSERVADEVGSVEAGLVHRALDRVGQQGVGDLPLDSRPARVPGQRKGEDVVVALERR